MEIYIDYSRIAAVSEALKKLKLKQDSYDDQRFFPPKNMDREIQLGYFASMVAVDHRTGTPISVFEGHVDGEFFHGADLLYRLGRILLEEDPEFFTPERLSKLSWAEAKRLFSFSGNVLWDYMVRVFLLRDLGYKLLASYGSYDKLFSVDNIRDFLVRLHIFRAYEDPIQKKSFLLAKFLYGRGLINFVDKKNFGVAVDNHLSRIAIRLGLVRFEDYGFLEKNLEVGYDVDVAIRSRVKVAYKLLSENSKIDPFALDDYFWSFGREICTHGKPDCKQCLFKDVCLARSVGKFWEEHRYTLTWYY